MEGPTWIDNRVSVTVAGKQIDTVVDLRELEHVPAITKLVDVNDADDDLAFLIIIGKEGTYLKLLVGELQLRALVASSTQAMRDAASSLAELMGFDAAERRRAQVKSDRIQRNIDKHVEHGLTPTTVTCPGCGKRHTRTIWQGYCKRCAYDLGMVPHGKIGG